MKTESTGDQSYTAGPGIRNDDDALATRIERDLLSAVDASKDWREEAARTFLFRDGYQWADEHLQLLEEMRRPAISFNRIGAIVDIVAGMEIMNRHEVRYTPVEIGDVGVNELLTGAAEWVRDKGDEEFTESRCFKDLLTCGVGATLRYMSYDDDALGQVMKDHLDPMSTYWDSVNARRPDKHRWRAYVKFVQDDELEEMFGDDVMDRIEPASYWKDWLPERNDISPHDATNAHLYMNNAVRQRQKKGWPLVEYQYCKKEQFYRVRMPQSGWQEYSKEDYAELKDGLSQMGIVAQKVMRKRYYRAFLVGKTILENEQQDWPDFTIQMMCGKWDDEAGGWYGVVRPMIGAPGQEGPQQLANKLYSEIAHVISVNSKGGLLAEVGAAVNQRELEDNWAAAESVIWLNDGALSGPSGPRIQPKPQGQYPQGMDRLMEWTIRSIPEVTGISPELMGIQQREQAGVLEYQRKQAGLTILAEFMDAIRLYRIRDGRVLAHFITEYLAGDSEDDSQLVRLRGDQGARYEPLLRDKLTMKFDVVVDEAPASPNVKDRVWAVLTDLLPILLRVGLMPPPEVLDYSPLPEGLREAWKKQLSQPNPQQQQAAQIDQAEKMADIEETKSKTMLNQMKAQAEAADANVATQKLHLDAAKLQVEAGKAMSESMQRNADRAESARQADAKASQVQGGG